MNTIEYVWTDGTHEDFQRFYRITEHYYSELVGGEEHRRSFIPFNISETISDVILAYTDGIAIACAGLKRYSGSDAEVKRVWVEPEYRGKHIASDLMDNLEERAKEQGYQRTILQTREIMTDAVRMYEGLGYHQIKNYPPYDKMDGAVCFAKEL